MSKADIGGEEDKKANLNNPDDRQPLKSVDLRQRVELTRAQVRRCDARGRRQWSPPVMRSKQRADSSEWTIKQGEERPENQGP